MLKSNKVHNESAPIVISARKIEDNVRQGKVNNLEIDFYSNLIYTWHGAFQLHDVGMDLKVRGCESTGYMYVGADDQLVAKLLVGDVRGDGENYEAYLVAKADNTKAVVHEIEDLFLFAVDPDEKQLAVYCNHRPFENKMALLFSDDTPLPFIPDLLDDIKCSKLSDYVVKLINDKVPTVTAQPTEPPTFSEKQVYIQSCFSQMAVKLTEFDGQDFSQRPEANRDDPCILDVSNLPKFNRQTLSPDQMREACEAIREQVRQDSWCKKERGFCTEINFLDFNQKHGGDTFYLSDAVILFRGINEDKTTGCGFLECYRMDVRVHIGNYEGSVRAFIEAEKATGEYRIAEMAEFGLLSTFEVNGSNLAVFTMFDKELGIVKFDILDSPRNKHLPRTDIPLGAKAPRNCDDRILTCDE